MTKYFPSFILVCVVFLSLTGMSCSSGDAAKSTDALNPPKKVSKMGDAAAESENAAKENLTGDMSPAKVFGTKPRAAEPILKREKELYAFLTSTPGTQGWYDASKHESVVLDFQPSGQLKVSSFVDASAPRSGKWSLDLDKLTLDRPDLGGTATVIAIATGDTLLLNGRPWLRYGRR